MFKVKYKVDRRKDRFRKELRSYGIACDCGSRFFKVKAPNMVCIKCFDSISFEEWDKLRDESGKLSDEFNNKV